ncbi:MAG: RNA polymerase sigma factor [Bacteroidota bacterium]
MSSKLYKTVILSHSDSLFRFALSILKEPEAAKDAVQDCLVKIWKKRDQLDEVDNVQAWAFRVVKNHCLDIVRGSRHTEGLEHTYTLSDGQTADFDLLYQDQEQWLQRVLARLPEKQRQIFHLREVEEMSYQEIAQVMEITMSEVKVSLHRARGTVRSSMQKVETYGT